MNFAHNWRKGRADYSRRRLGNKNLEETADKLVRLLTQGNFPFSIAGGYAVQHHGYPRFTEDVDVIVVDIESVRDYLSMRGFKEAQGTTTILYDRANGTEVNLLPSGIRLSPKSLPVPEPDETVLTLIPLLNNKISSYLSSPVKRMKDMADVVELVKRNLLPRDLPLHDDVRATYEKMWDDLQTEEDVVA